MLQKKNEEMYGRRELQAKMNAVADHWNIQHLADEGPRTETS